MKFKFSRSSCLIDRFCSEAGEKIWDKGSFPSPTAYTYEVTSGSSPSNSSEGKMNMEGVKESLIEADLGSTICEFYRKIIFSGEVHFHSSNNVNKQNWHIWGTKNQIFLKKEEGATGTFNGERYRAMLIDWFFEGIEAEENWGPNGLVLSEPWWYFDRTFQINICITRLSRFCKFLNLPPYTSSVLSNQFILLSTIKKLKSKTNQQRIIVSIICFFTKVIHNYHHHHHHHAGSVINYGQQSTVRQQVFFSGWNV